MKFPSGKTANLFTSFNLASYKRLTAFADKGKSGLEPCFGTQGQKGWASDPKVQMDLFSQAILEGKEWKVDGTEGLRDHLVMEAIFKSVASGRAEAVGKV